MINYIIIAITLSSVLLLASYIITVKNKTLAKISPYECGYDASYRMTKTLDIKYYIIAILFLIFDLEISYLYPYILLESPSINEYYTMIYLIYILTIAFIYEWHIGALKW